MGVWASFDKDILWNLKWVAIQFVNLNVKVSFNGTTDFLGKTQCTFECF